MSFFSGFLVLAGAAVMVSAVLARLAGHSHIRGYETMSFFIGGMGLVLLGSSLRLF